MSSKNGFFWIAYEFQSILLRWTKRTQSKNEMSRLLVDAMHAGNSHKNQITDAWICVSKNPEKKTIYVRQNNCDTCVSNFQITLYDRDAGSWFQPLDEHSVTSSQAHPMQMTTIATETMTTAVVVAATQI